MSLIARICCYEQTYFVCFFSFYFASNFMFPFQRLSAWTCSIDIACSTDMQQDMLQDMQHRHCMQHGHAALTWVCSKDIQQ
jgi:hypothetical protein